MDYKTNVLKDTVETGEELLPEIPNLHFAILGENKAVFDATAYFKENELTPVDYKLWMRNNKHLISTIAQNSGTSTSELFFQNGNGNILIAAELVFIFLIYCDPGMLLYFNNLLVDAISNGVAYSNSFAVDMAYDKIPTHVLQTIIKDRENAENGD